MIDCSAGYCVRVYTLDYKQAWDSFLSVAKNSSFLFYRDYMGYHSDFFVDHSLMIYKGNKLLGLLPANISAGRTLISHEGLTYGGLVVRKEAGLKEVLECFYACLRYLHSEKIERLLYKKIPTFYNDFPDDEVAYIMFLLDAHLYRRDCAIVVPLSQRLPIQERRSRQIRKAMQFGVKIVESMDFYPFWEDVLIPRLVTRYGVKPVHTADEITMLASRFPAHIRQFSAYHEERIVAGVTIYETQTVAHAQYIAVSEEGQSVGALDFLFAWLLNERYRLKRYFDFGICNEDEGHNINQGLLDWKEGFGGRSYCHDFYDIHTDRFDICESVFRERNMS
jgi:hypothetical protein